MTTEAISTLVDRRRRFLQFVVRRVKDHTIAEDILQAAYARAFNRQSSLRSNDSVKAWFYRILRNAIIDYYRRRDVEGRVLEPLSPEADRSAEPIKHCFNLPLRPSSAGPDQTVLRSSAA